MSENRDKFLARLIGKDRTVATRKGLSTAESILDKLGIERKDADVSALAAKIAKAVKDASEGDVEGVVVATLTAELDAIEEEEDSTGEPAAESEDDEDAGDDVVGENPLETIVKAFGEQASTMTKDVGDIAKSQMQQAKDQADMFKALGVVVERLEKVEKSLDGRPRSASKAAETAIDDDGTDAFKGLLKRLEKGAEGEKTFLGFEVAEEPK